MTTQGRTQAAIALGCGSIASALFAIPLFVYILHWLLKASDAPPSVWAAFYGYVPAVVLASLMGAAIKAVMGGK